MLMIWISDDLLRVIYLLWLVDLFVGVQHCSLLLHCLPPEYMAVTEVFKEAIWMHGLINDLGIL